MITASPLFNFAAASCDEISVMFFLASATSFWNPVCSAIIDKSSLIRTRQIVATVLRPVRNLRGDAAQRRGYRFGFRTTLLVAERFDGIEGGGFARGIKAEEHADGSAE